MTIALWSVTGLALLISLLVDHRKTKRALLIAGKRLGMMAPLFLWAMGIYALFRAYVPAELIELLIGRESGWWGLAIGLGLGSLALMPGFVAFPLCAMLRTQGVPYFVLAGFSVALMNVGVTTFPVEARYLGFRVALIRNVVGLMISLVIALIVGLAYGELG